MGSLTTLTNNKIFNGLTPTASKCLSLRSLNRYKQAIKKRKAP
jgi:hypothetical protein